MSPRHHHRHGLPAYRGATAPIPARLLRATAHTVLCHRLRCLLTQDRGSAAMELTLLTPLFLGLLLLVVFCGRGAHISLRLNDIAHQAARAASLAREASQATAHARRTAETALATAGITCRAKSVVSDIRRFRPGGTVTVTVSCTLDLSQLTYLNLPGARTVTASSSAPVDPYRGVATGGTP